MDLYTLLSMFFYWVWFFEITNFRDCESKIMQQVFGRKLHIFSTIHDCGAADGDEFW